uniref:two-partner secretion domain-containing protein n=1 Tax=Oceanivirga salmonicida TaxID=1769291 RepID=UPI0018D219F7
IEALSKNDLSVILSNENGITVDGANFINIHNMTLTTSKVKDNDGKLEYSKPKGEVLSLSDLDTTDVERFNIKAKILKVQGDVKAKKLLVETKAGEKGIPISADIVGSIHADRVTIVATNSGIGVKSINANKTRIKAKEIKYDKINSKKTYITLEDDFKNEEKIKADKRLYIKAKNILNEEGKNLKGRNIILEADDKVVNSNGSKISADKYLHIKAKKLENIGKIEDFGKLKKIWKDKDGKVYDEKDVEKWQIRKELTQ